LGATVSCSGAVGARLVSEAYPLNERIPIWLAGAVVVFFGLGVLSLGTRRRLEPDDDPQAQGTTAAETSTAEQPSTEQLPESVGAGEGNRTLV
jgi:hypothetical protein